MTEQARRAEAVQADIVAEVFNKTPEGWNAVKDDVVSLASYARSKRLIRTDDRLDEWTERYFLNPHPDSIRVFGKKGNKVIGFSSAYRAYSWSEEKKGMYLSPTVAEIDLSVVAPEEQRKGYIGVMGEAMDEELKRRGFERFWVHARERYANAIERHYGTRVLSSSLVIPGEKFLVVAF